MTDQDWIPIPRVGWGVGMASTPLVTGLCPGGRVRTERLAQVILDGRMDPGLMPRSSTASIGSKRRS